MEEEGTGKGKSNGVKRRGNCQLIMIRVSETSSENDIPFCHFYPERHICKRKKNCGKVRNFIYSKQLIEM
jgi:hypothetical protein